jgi:hypothetical protein
MTAQRTAACCLMLPALQIRSMAGLTCCIFAIFLAAELRRAVPSTQRNQSSPEGIAVAFIMVVVVVVVMLGAVVVVVIVVVVVALSAVVVVIVVVFVLTAFAFFF